MTQEFDCNEGTGWPGKLIAVAISVPSKRPSVVGKFVLDSQLLLLEQLDRFKVRQWVAHFFGNPAFQSGVFDLQCTDMRLFHRGFSL
jgi:hypothetical protein